MRQKNFKYFAFVFIFIFSKLLLAADENSDEFSLEPDTNYNALPEPTANTNLASPIEVLQKENALYGFSVGLVYSVMPFTEKYSQLNRTLGKSESIDRQTESVSNIGFMLRYAVAPFYKLGADINVSFLKSQNHSNIMYAQTKTLSEVTTLKAELNLTYAVSIGKALPLYFLVGAGAEQVYGASIEELLNSNGVGAQAGGGIVFSSTINVEGLYAYYLHRVSNTLVAANGAGLSPYDIDTSSGRIINQGLIIRGSYSF
jgi:hypothetical protein